MGQEPEPLRKSPYPAPGKYNYEIREEALLKGYRFDTSRYRVVFTVEEDPNNPLQLLLKKEIFKDNAPADQILFINELRSRTSRDQIPRGLPIRRIPLYRMKVRKINPIPRSLQHRQKFRRSPQHRKTCRRFLRSQENLRF